MMFFKYYENFKFSSKNYIKFVNNIHFISNTHKKHFTI